MIIWNVPKTSLEKIVADVSATKYKGNLLFNRFPEKKGRALVFTLRVADSHGPGARRSASGRRLVSASWHAHRDVMLALFTQYPNARVKTAIADYRGRESFNTLFPATGNKNIGGVAQPCRMQDACECEA